MKRVILLCGVVFLLSISPASSWAHLFDYQQNFSDMGKITVNTIHDDSTVPKSEAKGSAVFTFTNNTGITWGDFHFEIFGGGAVFDSNETPLMDGASVSFNLNNSNSILDLYYYNNPVNNGESVSFSIYTDNTTTGGLFGMSLQPTPVPLPGAVLLLGSCMVGIAGLRRGKK